MFSQRKPTRDCKLLFIQFSYESKIRAETTTAVLKNSRHKTHDVDEILQFNSLILELSHRHGWKHFGLQCEVLSLQMCSGTGADTNHVPHTVQVVQTIYQAFNINNTHTYKRLNYQPGKAGT